MGELLPSPGSSALEKWRDEKDRRRAALDEIRTNHADIFAPMIEASLAGLETKHSLEDAHAYPEKLEELAHQLVVDLLMETEDVNGQGYSMSEMASFVGEVIENPLATTATRQAITSLVYTGVVNMDQHAKLSLAKPHQSEVVAAPELETL